MKHALAIADENIVNRIYHIRSKKVMLDRDLSELYGVGTKVFNQAVKRNMKRFPSDFMFQLSREEYSSLRSQFVTLEKGRGKYSKYNPYAFTEQGVSMLSSILNSEQAILVSIQIMRIFTRMRELLVTHKDILLKLEHLEKKILAHDKHYKKHEDEIQLIFDALKQLLDTPQQPRKRVGYRQKGEGE